MKNWLHINVIIIMLGFFLMPALTYACETKSDKSCCKKESSFKTEKKDCCNKKNSENKNSTCGGKCGHSNCTTSSANFSILSFCEIEFKNNIFEFPIEKPKLYYLETFISSGFSSVWLPPKIN